MEMPALTNKRDLQSVRYIEFPQSPETAEVYKLLRTSVKAKWTWNHISESV